MTEKVVVELLAIPAKEISSKLGIDAKALISLVIANTHWLQYEKPFFDFTYRGSRKIPKYTEDAVFEIYENFILSFNDFNDRKLKTSRELKRYWRNRDKFDLFIYSLENSGLISEFTKKKAIMIGNKYKEHFELYLLKDENGEFTT